MVLCNFLILFLIIFVAAFNLISSIIMIVKDKERGIGILRSLGVKSKEIQRIFKFPSNSCSLPKKKPNILSHLAAVERTRRYYRSESVTN